MATRFHDVRPTRQVAQLVQVVSVRPTRKTRQVAQLVQVVSVSIAKVWSGGCCGCVGE